MKEGQLDLEALATAFADSKERRGCSYWQGLYNGFKAGYSSSLPSSSVTGEEVRRNIVSEIKSAICDDEKSEADIAYSICIRIINKHFESLPVTGESEAINKAIIEELQSLLSSSVHPEYLPEKINDRISELKGDKSYT